MTFVVQKMYCLKGELDASYFCIDVFSRRTTVYPIKAKNQVLNSSFEFMAIVNDKPVPGLRLSTQMVVKSIPAPGFKFY